MGCQLEAIAEGLGSGSNAYNTKARTRFESVESSRRGAKRKKRKIRKTT